MKLVAGIESLGLPERFSNAQRRIILHAAIYGPFAESPPHRAGLLNALDKESFERVDVIAMQTASSLPWENDFFNILRFNTTKEARKRALKSSGTFLDELKTANPSKVFIHPMTALPTCPTIIVDNTIIFGQYAHASLYAGQGFWGIIESDVQKLLTWVNNNCVPKDASDQERAAYRLVSECSYAIQHEGA